MNHKRYHRDQFIFFIKSGQKLPFLLYSCSPVSLIPAGCLIHLFPILQCIIDHVSHRHGTMDICLIFNSDNQVCRLTILHNYCRFQNIPVLLYTFRFLPPLVMYSVFKQNSQFRGIHFFQFFRPDDRFSSIDQIITCICKYIVLPYIIFCYYICCSHVGIFSSFFVCKDIHMFMFLFVSIILHMII